MLFRRGIIDERTLKIYREQSAKIGKDKSEFAWILNRLKEERQQGRSIETHNWCFDTERFEIDLLDAPGHSNFIKNILTQIFLLTYVTKKIDYWNLYSLQISVTKNYI